jgi:hypothetical protein
MNLIEFQRRMFEDVCRPLTSDFAMQTQTQDGQSVSKIANSYVKPNDRLSSFERLEIYNRQYWFRVIDAVSEDYPALQALLGTRKFDAMILAYLRETPSNSFTLRDLGASLPTWLKINPQHAGTRLKLALDVAALEWAYVEAFDRAALPPMVESDLLRLSEVSKLQLQPHLQLLQLHYPVDELVLAVHREQTAADIVSNAVVEHRHKVRPRLPKMLGADVHLAVHRCDNSVYYRRLEPEAFALLAGLRQGLVLGEAVAAAFAESKHSEEEQVSRIRQCFAHAAELGWFCGQGAVV